MKKIHVEEQTEKHLRNGEVQQVRMHYVYLVENGQKTFLRKQRWYYGVSQYFRKDLPVDAIRRHKWGRDRMVDHLLRRLPQCLAEAERYSDDRAA